MANVPGRAKRAARAARERVGSVYSVSAVVALECERSAWTGLAGRCRWCNKVLEGRRQSWCSDACHKTFELNHIWSEAKAFTLRQAKHTCERVDCGVSSDLQVNHIDPVVGRGYQPSCFHHLDNLEALCRPHHQIETNAQRQHRQTHWVDGALTGSIVLPAASLAQALRSDLIKRMLDRRSGWPFLLPGDDFEATGVYHRYRPNTAWKTALADLQANHAHVRVWEPQEQAWVPLSYYASSAQRCAGKNANGTKCKRFGSQPLCWQHAA